jgi:hypothetical protein
MTIPTMKIETARDIIKALGGFHSDTKVHEQFGQRWFTRRDIIGEAMKLGDIPGLSEEDAGSVAFHLEQAVAAIEKARAAR